MTGTPRRAWLTTGLGLALAACAATSSKPGALEPRFVAVHNTLAAMGMAQVGPIQRGSLAEGRDTRFAVDLPAECATVVAIGSGDVRDLELTVRDADDKEVARDATTDPEAAVKLCPTRAGKFSMVVRMAKGAGEFVVASWTGAPSSSAAPIVVAGAEEGAGTCESPIPLATGFLTGNTRKGESEHNSDNCGNSDAKELVYKLELEKRSRVLLGVEPTFDSVLYVRKDDCADTSAQVACNDDATPDSSGKTTHASRIEEVFDPGTYYVFVDGYQSNVGAFKMTVEINDVPALAEECLKTQPLVQHAQGALTGHYDGATGSCGAGKGPEVPYKLDVPSRARTRVTLHSSDFKPALHVRRSCVDESTELACASTGMRDQDAVLVTTLDPGSYTVFADSTERGEHGPYQLDVDLTTENGRGARGDACADAIAIGADAKVDGDTFDAKDDFAGTCAAKGAPDQVYRFEVSSRSRVVADFETEEGSHVFTLLRSCADHGSQVACGPRIDEVLNPGVYFLAVDGGERAPFGRFKFRLRSKDIALQDAACKAPGAIALGQTIQGTTLGAPDRFTASCAGRVDTQASGDRVYKLVVPTRQRIQLLLSTPSHDGVLALRKTCPDPAGMKNPREAEVTCNNDSPDTRHSKIDTTVEAGTYYVVVDGHIKNEGAFTLEAKAVK